MGRGGRRVPHFAATLSLPLCGERRAAYCYVHASQRVQFVEYVAAHLEEYADLKESEYVHIGVHGGMSAQEMYVPLIVLEA